MQCTCGHEAHPLYGGQCEDCWSSAQYGQRRPRFVGTQKDSEDQTIRNVRAALGLTEPDRPLSSRVQRAIGNASQVGVSVDAVKLALGFT